MVGKMASLSWVFILGLGFYSMGFMVNRGLDQYTLKLALMSTMVTFFVVKIILNFGDEKVSLQNKLIYHIGLAITVIPLIMVAAEAYL